MQKVDSDHNQSLESYLLKIRVKDSFFIDLILLCSTAIFRVAAIVVAAL
jgi:hypothetical protein